MIQSLNIHNIALIENLTIPFCEGMHVLAGETGAGKSIVVDSVNLVLGGRADRDLIRNGTDKASVEAVFEVGSGHKALEILERESIDPEGNVISLYREISRSGRNICRLCGVVVPVSTLKEVADTLMDIHGQHEHTFLVKPEVQRTYLDGAGNEEHMLLMQKVSDACAVFLENHHAYSRLVKQHDRDVARFSELEKDLQELHLADLKADEEEELKKQVDLFRYSKKIAVVLKNAHEALTTGENGSSALSAVNEAMQSVKTIANIDKVYGDLSERTETIYYELQELAFDVHTLLEKNDFDPMEMARKEERLDLIRKLEKKYGTTVAQVLEKQHEMEKEYEVLAGMDDRISEMRSEHKKLLAVYRGLAKELTESRKAIAEHFEKNIQAELAQLGMEKTVFKVEFADKSNEKPTLPKPEGDDEICFLISPNPGEPLKPMEKIASGGELSRIMLAIKSLEAGHNGTGTMVFDEIDTGISGKMAQVVAEKMKKISANRQVICVSHLPQIFAMSDHRYLVSKSTSEGRTRTSVVPMDREGSIDFLSKMIAGGEQSGADAVKYAQKLIDSAKE